MNAPGRQGILIAFHQYSFTVRNASSSTSLKQQKNYFYHGSLTFLSAVGYPVYQLSGLLWLALLDVRLQETAVPAKITRNSTLFWLHSFPVLKHPLSSWTGL